MLKKEWLLLAIYSFARTEDGASRLSLVLEGIMIPLAFSAPGENERVPSLRVLPYTITIQRH